MNGYSLELEGLQLELGCANCDYADLKMGYGFSMCIYDKIPEIILDDSMNNICKTKKKK